MKKSLLSLLRNKKSDCVTFRQAADQLSHLIAADATALVEEEEIFFQTPLGNCKGCCLSEKVVLVPILRSGIALLSSFLYFFPNAKVGFLGIRRDEKSADPYLYYENLPSLTSQDIIFLLDPMVATAGSSLLATERILKRGGSAHRIHLMGILGSTQGVKRIQKEYPKMGLHLTAVDKKLNPKKFILPGLGDFGDRYFGTL
jgi:uracil phosphoribosyltransferase